ncbi:hypothetical protein KKG81_09015 [bacterium]|jgi:hypothetical protein|nr:hypothetical protein [bacterium]
MIKKFLFTISFIALGLTSLQAENRAPFLIMDMIPHMTMEIKKNWDNKELALDSKQKTKLLEIREETMAGVMNAKKKLAPLENEVATKILAGSTPEELENLVNEIAKYKVEATKTHLNCVYKTQKVLSKKQLEILKNL